MVKAPAAKISSFLMPKLHGDTVNTISFVSVFSNQGNPSIVGVRYLLSGAADLIGEPGNLRAPGQ